MSLHSMNVYLDDTAFDELKSIEKELNEDKESHVGNRSDAFAMIIHSYFSERKTMLARINYLETELEAIAEDYRDFISKTPVGAAS